MGRYVLIKPYTYTLDFLPQILGDYPSVKSDQSLSAIRVGNLPQPNWSFRARSIRPHDTFVAIPNPRHPFLFHASIYIWSRMMRLPTLRKTTAAAATIAANPLQSGISDSPSRFLPTVAFNFPVCASSNNPFSPYARQFVRWPRATRKFLRTCRHYTFTPYGPSWGVVRHMACTLRIASRSLLRTVGAHDEVVTISAPDDEITLKSTIRYPARGNMQYPSTCNFLNSE